MEHLNFKQTAICIGLLIALGLVGGGHILAHISFGILMLAGIVALVENVNWIKWIVYRSNVILDLFFFIFSVIATVQLGVTITGAITVASLIFSLIYAPMMRNKIKAQKLDKLEKEANMKNRYKRM